jgi:peptide/nickel transport system permease protein
MSTYIVRRLLYAALTFFGITVLVFALVHSVPGDPVTLLIGLRGPTQISPAALAAIRHSHHLDQPLAVQYFWWLRGVVHLDFGESFVDRRPVIEHIVARLPNTIVLNGIAVLLAALIGVPIGLWSATKSGRLPERASAVGFFLLYSLPSFWVALLLMELFSVKLRLLPLFGIVSDDYLTLPPHEQLFDRVRHLILPVICMAYWQLAIFARFSKAALTEVIRQDFITTARAKGAAEVSVIWHHALRNALIPLITLLGLTFPLTISGNVIIESMFGWNGVGQLLIVSIARRDYPIILGLSVCTAIATLLANLIADLLYAAADPRVRLEAR